MDDFQDPYDQANQSPEAKILTADPSPKKRRLTIVVIVAVGLLLGVVILANVAGMLSHPTVDANTANAKPTTMNKAQGDSFAAQQASHAEFIKGQDADKNQRKAEDTVMGNAANLAGTAAGGGDPCAEVEGVPPMTPAQRQAAGCGGGAGVAGGSQPTKPKSEAEIRREKQQLEAEHRRQNDIDSSPLAVDFSDYFEKKAPPATAATTESNAVDPQVAAMEAKAAAVQEQTQRGLAEFAKQKRQGEDEGERGAERGERAGTVSASRIKEPHDPQEDYVFDSSFGKQYRLMEDTIVETVLVNRLAGAAPGPVIVMVREDVYSHSGARLLIPKGTRLLGKVTAVASLNQERLFVAFHRMIMPDGYSVSLDKFQGLDVIGQTGLRDLVNHHYVQIFGASLALAAVGAVTQIGNTGSAYGAYDFGVSMRNGASEQLGQSSQRIMERFLNTLPAFTIRERALVKVVLSGDLVLPDVKNHNMDPDL